MNILKCKYCKQPTKYHSKCNKCKILLHSNQDRYICSCGGQHTLRGESIPTYCKKCETKILDKYKE